MLAHFRRILVFIILLFVFFTKPAFAQSYAPQVSNTISPTSAQYTDLLIQNMFHSFSCLTVGSSIINQPCLSYQKGIPVLSQANLTGGTLGALASLLDNMYQNPPVRGIDYLSSIGEGLGVVKVAQAQGVGGSGQAVLNPILALWQTSRNIAYLLMIIIFVIIGLMVMFRQRINPQTVISAQTALPGLVIGLILITFSYFLASLITDTAFVGTNLVGYYFESAQNLPLKNLVEDTKDQNVLTIASRFTGIITKDNAANALSAIWDNFSEDVRRLLTAAAMFFTASITGQLAGGFSGIPVAGPFISAGAQIISALGAAANPTAVVGLFIWIIAVAMIVYSMIMLLYRLIKNYLTIIFLVISAPFHFLVASLPGRQGVATSWILNMLCNVLAFPAVMGLFYFVGFILGSTAVPGTPFQLSSGAALTSTSNLPLLGGIDLSFIRLLIAFGAIVASPTIPEIVCKTIGRPSAAGQLIGQEIGQTYGRSQGYIGQARQGIPEAGKGLFGEQVFNPQGDPIRTRKGLLDILRRK